MAYGRKLLMLKIRFLLLIISLTIAFAITAQATEITTKMSGALIHSISDFHQKAKVALFFPSDYRFTFASLKNALLSTTHERTLTLENLSALRAQIGAEEYQILIETLIESARENSSFQLILK